MSTFVDGFGKLIFFEIIVNKTRSEHILELPADKKTNEDIE
jgi:hypothetical protein